MSAQADPQATSCHARQAVIARASASSSRNSRIDCIVFSGNWAAVDRRVALGRRPKISVEAAARSVFGVSGCSSTGGRGT